MRKKVDINTWKRKLAYETFSNYDDPYTGLVTKIDVTNLVNYCKKNKLSFYAGMSYFILKSMSQIDAFYYGYGKSNNRTMVYKYEKLAMTATVIDENQELNFTRYVCYTEDFHDFIFDFCSACHDASNSVPYYIISGLEDMNKVNVTCIPWVSFSNFKDAINFSEKNSKPKVCWGKYYSQNDKVYIDVSLLVNHAFQDGYHIGLFFNNLQEEMYNIDNIKTYKKVRR